MSRQTFRMIRLEMQLTQSEFGSLLGVSTSTISHIENGRRQMSDKLRVRLAQVIDVPEFINFFERYEELDNIISV